MKPHVAWQLSPSVLGRNKSSTGCLVHKEIGIYVLSNCFGIIFTLKPSALQLHLFKYLDSSVCRRLQAFFLFFAQRQLPTN